MKVWERSAGPPSPRSRLRRPSRWVGKPGQTCEDLRARFAAHATAYLVTDLASPRPRPGAVVGYHTRIALRELGRHAEFLDSQIVSLDALITPLVTGHTPGLLALHGVGPDIAALLLVAAGDHPERLRSEAAWAHLCAAAPIPASSGKTKRHRLNPVGDRQAGATACQCLNALGRVVPGCCVPHGLPQAERDDKRKQALNRRRQPLDHAEITAAVSCCDQKPARQPGEDHGHRRAAVDAEDPRLGRHGPGDKYGPDCCHDDAAHREGEVARRRARYRFRRGGDAESRKPSQDQQHARRHADGSQARAGGDLTAAHQQQGHGHYPPIGC